MKEVEGDIFMTTPTLGLHPRIFHLNVPCLGSSPSSNLRGNNNNGSSQVTLQSISLWAYLHPHITAD